MERLERRGVAPENILTPRPQITAGVFQGVQAAGPESDPTLRDLFANLLSAEMEQQRASQVHPAFSEILNQITPDEARILRALGRRTPLPVLQAAKVQIISGILDNDVDEVLLESEILVQEVELRRPELLKGYLDNLLRLGVVKLTTEEIRCPKVETDRGYTVNRLDAAREMRGGALRYYLSLYGIEAAGAVGKVFDEKCENMERTRFGRRPCLEVELIRATAFGNQLLRSSIDPDEIGSLSQDEAIDLS